jgi:hypothetical protein
MNYILDGHIPIPVHLMTWGEWMQTHDRKVAYDEVGGYRISTVFLGMDHSFGGGPPLLFETMVFPGESWGEVYCERYSTWEQAEAGHAAALAEYTAQEE